MEYVGSTRSLKVRVFYYFNLAHIEDQKNRPIHRAIIKYGLISIAFIVLEEVDTNLHKIEERETSWIVQLKPNYNETTEAASNKGWNHTAETKKQISTTKSTGVILIYNEFKQLLALSPSLTSIAKLLANSSMTIALNRAIDNKSLFRSSWYFSRVPFNASDVPSIDVPSPEYLYWISKMKSQKHILRAIFVFKDKEFLCKYDGVMEAQKALKISHMTIKKHAENNIEYKGNIFSYHRLLDV